MSDVQVTVDTLSVTVDGDEVAIEVAADVLDVTVAGVGVQGPTGPTGPQGSQGPQGIQGPPGQAGAAPQAYLHDQAVPASVWYVVHNLGYRPAVVVTDSAGTQCEGTVVYPTSSPDDVNQLEIHFDLPFGGKASCT